MNTIETYIDQVIEGDCLDILPQLPAQSVDLVLCDLPYGVTNNSWDEPIDLAALWMQYRRVLKSGGVILLTGQGKFTARLILSQEALFRYKIVWIKQRATNFLSANKQPLRKHEDICVFFEGNGVFHPQKTKGQAYNKGRRRQSSDNYHAFKGAPILNTTGKRFPHDVVYYEEEDVPVDYLVFRKAETEDRAYHPTQKPVMLGRYLVRSYSDPGAVVLDNACGVGSFLVAAILEGRHFIGIEKNKAKFRYRQTTTDFISVCHRRIEAAKAVMRSHLPFPE